MEMKQSPLKTQLDILWRPHPLLPAADCELRQQTWKPGQTIREVLLANGVDPHQPIVIVLDDRLLTVEEWDTISPQPGQIINVKAEVEGGGGGGGSNAIQIVAMVALVIVAVAAPYLAPASWGTLTAAGGLSMTGAMMTAGIMMAGSLVINSVFAANIAANDMGLNGSSGQYAAASPTYSLSGGQNRTRPYESMPVIMGVHRHIPDNAAKPFTEYHGEDQYLYQVFHLGLSTTDKSDWRIGTNPISNYTNWNWTYTDSAGRINSFPGNVDSAPGAVLENASGWIVRSTSPDTYRIGIDLEGTLYYANNSGGLDATSVQLRVQYKPSNSPNWIDPTQITTSGSGFVSGSYQPYYVKIYHFRRMFGGGYTETYEISKAEYDAAVSNQRNVYDEDGNLVGNSASNYEQRWRFVAGSGGTIIVSGASQAPRRASLFIDVPIGSYDVRVIRDTGDTTDARLQNKTNWSTLRSYQADRANYNGQSRIGLSIKASEQLNGTIQQLSYMAEAYASYWNGSAWTFEKTSNPAHWFMDFARGRFDSNGNLLYGLGMSESQIDLAGLNAWATFCASEGLSFNAVLDRNQTAADLLTAIARCGFASPSWASGRLGVVWDARNAAPVAAFGMSNIIRGSFEVSYITEQLAEEIIVRFTNPSKDWVQDEVRTLVPGVTTPTRSSSVDLMGCTNSTMAGKFANYLAAQQYYRRRRVKWECDFEGFVCQRGDVVLLSHDLTQWGYSGRIVATNGNTLTLDRTVPRNGGVEYLMVKRPDGTMTTYSVKAGSGDADTVELIAAPNLQSDSLPMDHVWFFSPLATPGKKVKILNVQPVSESRVQVVATDEDPQFYAAWDGTWTNAPNSTLLPNIVPSVSNLAISEHLVKTTVGVQAEVTVSWKPSISVERCRVTWRMGNGPAYTLMAYGQSISFVVPGPGNVSIEIVPISPIRSGTPVTKSQQIYGLTLPPEDVPWFNADGTLLSWGDVSDLDLAGYRLRWAPGATGAWHNSQPLHTGLVTDSPWRMQSIANGAVTIMIKAVDTSGNESNEPAYITMNLGDMVLDNVLTTRDLKALGFPGKIGGGLIVGGNLTAISTNSIWNPNNTAPMWTVDSDAMWNLTYYSALTYRSEITVASYEAGSRMTVTSTIAGESWGMDYRKGAANDATMWGASQTTMWSGDDAAPMRNNAPGWIPWLGQINAELGAYEFRVRTVFSRTQGVVSALSVNFDVPDIAETIHDQTISAAGTRLVIKNSYHGIKAVNLTVQDDGGTGRTARVMDKSTTGPLVKVFDISGNPTSGKLDAIVQGY